jgi:putative NIF3 family GTP cyclohydrolase 1 type 2
MSAKTLVEETEDHDIIIMREQGGHEIALGVVANFKITDKYFVDALQDFVDRWRAGEVTISDLSINQIDEGLH